MKANELMVGDILQNENTDYVLVRSVADTAVKDFCIVEVLDGVHQGDIQRVHCEDLTQIHLTPEILEKNGFEVQSEHARYYFEEEGEKYEFVLRKMYYIDNPKVQKGWSFYAFNVLTLVDYVHELQHALRLCGIEKEIEI